MCKICSVFLDDVFLKSFSTYLEADILASGLRAWLVEHDMNIDAVHIEVEVEDDA